LAETREGLGDYFSRYRIRAVLDYLKWRFEKQAEGIYRKHVSDEYLLRKSAKKAYWFYKKALR
jgi:hypothetical protein